MIDFPLIVVQFKSRLRYYAAAGGLLRRGLDFLRLLLQLRFRLLGLPLLGLLLLRLLFRLLRFLGFFWLLLLLRRPLGLRKERVLGALRGLLLLCRFLCSCSHDLLRWLFLFRFHFLLHIFLLLRRLQSFLLLRLQKVINRVIYRGVFGVDFFLDVGFDLGHSLDVHGAVREDEHLAELAFLQSVVLVGVELLEEEVRSDGVDIYP